MGVAAALLAPVVVSVSPGAQAAPVGQGFELNASDLRFILKQIKIAEHHVANTTELTGACGALIGEDPNQIPAGGVGVTLPWGLRTVDGTCNNLVDGQSKFGTADQTFPRIAPREDRPTYPVPNDPDNPTIDPAPRTISNLIVDQSPNNPAAVAAAGDGAELLGDPDTGETFFIPNVAPDTGLSAPYNSWFTLFGQFFDHGLDLVNKGGDGTVTITLTPDDPLWGQGPPVMFLTRATKNAEGESTNQTSSWVDQSQTYTSHPAHQVFLRDYDFAVGTGVPTASGSLIIGPGDGMATWSTVKAQALQLGIALDDMDVFGVPLVVTDPYGNFVPGDNGFPQVVFPDDTTVDPDDVVAVEGDPLNPLDATDAVKTGHAFLDDIAHHAAPKANQTPDLDLDAETVGLFADDHDSTTYDDEMLDAHYIAGDGRVNENIGLTAVHHVFHSEHNRLVEEIDTMIHADLSAAEIAEWEAVSADAPAGSGFDYGERLFQAARFVTEMEYQHLAFEEFIRKVQPMVNLFGEGGTGYHTDLDPRITAEFAHAVYRFGHSMLTESVDRVTPEGTHDDMPLLQAFLNPPSFFDNEIDAEQAAGNIIRGMTRQVGNELDEFVTEALRNDLIGLPLDLAALNIARGRDTGIPTLNSFRRTVFARTSDSALAPYASWTDFGFALRHPESLTNFIAAYGTHPSITGDITSRRAAAEALLNTASTLVATPGATSTAQEIADYWSHIDAVEFLESMRAPDVVDDLGTPSLLDDVVLVNPNPGYASTPDGVTITGVDLIDLWMGGLAEKQNVFGGLLGPTFNYVFEYQMESLQDGDRFYYLSRTAGLNLLTQLEGNSFAELIQRNTDVEGLPADSFSTPARVFDLSKQNASGPIIDDIDTEWDETQELVREPNGTIRYPGVEHVVFNGSPNNDKAKSSEGDDTMRGNVGNDVFEGGDGNDNLIGGDGDDILTDLFGDDVIKGGPGNDTISSGRGFGGDLNQGGTGNDFIIGGNDMTETFGGPGNDFVFAGDAEDAVFGDDGDDWIEGGRGPFALLQGDNGAPFQDDPNEPGHDVLFGYGGEQDYDAEGGDDVMFAGPGIQRSEGMLGFDWVTHRGDPVAGNSDMAFSALLPPAVDVNRDRFDLVEALSGWDANDVLRGDSADAASMTGHELTAAGVARIQGLETIVPASGFTGGNIILGGGGNDLIEGRGGDDVIDGDAWLDAQLVAPNPATSDPNDVRIHNNLATLRADVMAGRVNPGSITIQRSIKTAPAASSIDTVVFSDLPGAYEITEDEATGVVTVAHNLAPAGDGVDTLTNVEFISFPIDPADPLAGTQVISLAVLFNDPAFGTIDLSSLAPVEDTLLSITAADLQDPQGVNEATVLYEWQMELPDFEWVTVGSGLEFTPGDGQVGKSLRVVATFLDNIGVPEFVLSEPTLPVENVNDEPLGQPIISSSLPEVGTELSVDVSAITDDDGLPADFSFQWFANGVAIGGATASTFTPGLAQENELLTVEATYTDLHGTIETVLSDPTEGVTRPPLPVVALSTSTLDFDTRALNTPPIGQSVIVRNDGTVPLTIDSVTLSGPDAARWNIVNGCITEVLPDDICIIDATLSTTGTTAGAKSATLTITSNDPNSPDTVSLSATLVVNSAPTGQPTVDDATPLEGQPLTAAQGTIADPDGLAGATFVFQWQQNNVGGAGAFVNIPGAVGEVFTPTQAQVNRRIRVQATFVDDHGTTQTLLSAGTQVVGDVFFGTAANEGWTGTAQADVATGGDGVDTLSAQAGDDLLSGDGGDDVVNGGAGNDIIRFLGGAGGFDTITGGNNVDVIEAMGPDTVIGLRSITSVEQITGNGHANVSISGSPLADTLNFGPITLTGIAFIIGGGGVDTISGSASADDIRGGAANDTLVGNGGGDTIRGGGGNDTITPSAGNDTVVFAPGDGSDRINGFDSNPTGGQDILNLSALGLTLANFGTVSITTVAGNTVISFAGVTITLVGVAPATISSADFGL
ncbi:MAG: choice-of-anchor D domain-containing protein [Actinobacteria bacterium]|nr:choice-of-anchor D domain-containing protein [Actinomycetota bacterium]